LDFAFFVKWYHPTNFGTDEHTELLCLIFPAQHDIEVAAAFAPDFGDFKASVEAAHASFLHEEITHELCEAEAIAALVVAFSVGVCQLWNLVVRIVDSDFVLKVAGVEFQPDTRVAPTANGDDFTHTGTDVPVAPFEIDGGFEAVAIDEVAIGGEHVGTHNGGLIAQFGTEKVVEIQADSPVFVGLVSEINTEIHVGFESLFQGSERPLIGKTGADPNEMGGRIHLSSAQLNIRTSLGVNAEGGERQKQCSNQYNLSHLVKKSVAKVRVFIEKRTLSIKFQKGHGKSKKKVYFCILS
jgi:hypothetical protein